MVEARGIEPLSENPSTELSPGADCRKISPERRRQSDDARDSLFIRDRYKDKLFSSRSSLNDARTEAAILSGRTTAVRQRVLNLR